MKKFFKCCADMGSVIIYIYIIIALAVYPCTEIMWIAAFGFICALYSQKEKEIHKKCNCLQEGKTKREKTKKQVFFRRTRIYAY